MPDDIETLLSLARLSGASTDFSPAIEFPNAQALEDFVELAASDAAERIRQDERERAVRICEDLMPKNERSDWTAYAHRRAETLTQAIDAIRSSGTSQSNPLLGGGNG